MLSKARGDFKFLVDIGQVIPGRLHKVLSGVMTNLTVTYSSGLDFPANNLYP
jgi:hypothetical protein